MTKGEPMFQSLIGRLDYRGKSPITPWKSRRHKEQKLTEGEKNLPPGVAISLLDSPKNTKTTKTAG